MVFASSFAFKPHGWSIGLCALARQTRLSDPKSPASSKDSPRARAVPLRAWRKQDVPRELHLHFLYEIKAKYCK